MLLYEYEGTCNLVDISVSSSIHTYIRHFGRPGGTYYGGLCAGSAIDSERGCARGMLLQPSRFGYEEEAVPGIGGERCENVGTGLGRTPIEWNGSGTTPDYAHPLPLSPDCCMDV